MQGAAKAASVERPIAGLPAASAMPRAAEMPTRRPVKLPGPVVTAMRSSAAKSRPARSITRAISGISASAWPRTMGSDSRARCRRLPGVEHGGRAGLERGIDGKDTHVSTVITAKAGDPVIADDSVIRSSEDTGCPSQVGHGRRASECRHRAYADVVASMTADYTGRTSTTSGTKCLSRFWMPCWSVAVEDGQPEQAPFMVR